MAKLNLFPLSFLLGSLAVSTAQAQVTVDVSKITCEQYLLDKVAEPRLLAAWLSGYYSSKRNTTIVDTQALASNADKVADYCRSNKPLMLMKAVETTLGLPK